MKKFKGKIIYNPSGKAEEYSYWAANFYNGCSGDCVYCYMKDPPLNQYWSTTPVLKKSLGNNIQDAYEIFQKEIKKNIDSLKKYGLFFNFNSDPFLENSFVLNINCICHALKHFIPIKVLTKQTWYLDLPLFKIPDNNIKIGFTLTGHDELEPGCATNAERIQAMKTLKERGFKTWASIEPIIDFQKSTRMIIETINTCDHFKIGLKSKTIYIKCHLDSFVSSTIRYIKSHNPKTTIYWKDSLLKQAGIDRKDLPSNCVNRDYL